MLIQDEQLPLGILYAICSNTNVSVTLPTLILYGIKRTTFHHLGIKKYILKVREGISLKHRQKPTNLFRKLHRSLSLMIPYTCELKNVLSFLVQKTKIYPMFQTCQTTEGKMFKKKTKALNLRVGLM